MVWSNFNYARVPSFGEQWNAGVKARLGELFPTSPNQRVAEVLGVSPEFVSRALSRVDRHLSLTHAERLATHLGRSAEYILAADTLAHFPTVNDLHAALAHDRSAVRDFLIALYRRHTKTPAPLTSSNDFVRRWRAEVKARLSQLMPGAGSTAERPTVSSAGLGKLLGKLPAAALTLINGPQYLTEAHARIIAAEFNVPVEWTLATDLLRTYACAGDLDRDLAGERKQLRDMMMRLHADLKPTCQTDLWHPPLLKVGYKPLPATEVPPCSNPCRI